MNLPDHLFAARRLSWDDLATGSYQHVDGFAMLAFWSLLPRKLREREDGLWELYTNRTVHRLCFKGGVLLFLAFSTGDILFGDRMELWEHGTFMVLILLTYDLWYRTDTFVEAQESMDEG